MSKDSLSSINSHSNPYSTTKYQPTNYSPKEKIKEGPDKIKDYLEFRKELLQQEAEESLKKEKLHRYLNKFLFVAHVGKYAILAILLPPYIVFYGIPKIFYLHAIPLLRDLLKKQIFKMGGVFSFLKETANNVLAQPIRNIWQAMQKQAVKGVETVTSLFQRIGVLLAVPLGEIEKSMKSFLEGIQKTIQFLDAKRKGIGLKISHFFQGKGIVELPLLWVENGLLSLKKMYEKLKKHSVFSRTKWMNGLAKIRSKLSIGLGEIIQRQGQWVVNQAALIVQPLYAWIELRFIKLQEYVNSKKEWWQKSIQYLYRGFKERIIESGENLKRVFQPIYLLFSRTFKWLSKGIDRWSEEGNQYLKREFCKLKENVKKACLKGVEKSGKVLRGFLKNFYELLCWLLITVVKKLKEIAFNSLRKIKNDFLKCLQTLRSILEAFCKLPFKILSFFKIARKKCGFIYLLIKGIFIEMWKESLSWLSSKIKI